MRTVKAPSSLPAQHDMRRDLSLIPYDLGKAVMVFTCLSERKRKAQCMHRTRAALARVRG